MKRKFIIIGIFLFIVGCKTPYSGYFGNYRYIGISKYFKKTSGTSNLTHKYPDPPVLDSNDLISQSLFVENAEDYLDGVINDLEEIKNKADNAIEKVNAVIDAVNFGYEYFSVNYIGSVVSIKSKSNLGIFGYPEFADFDYSPPIKPIKPIYFFDEYMIDTYNVEAEIYNQELADFAATIEDYIEDGEHYIENCNNDYNLIRKKGLNLINHIESLEIDFESDFN